VPQDTGLYTGKQTISDIKIGTTDPRSLDADAQLSESWLRQGVFTQAELFSLSNERLHQRSLSLQELSCKPDCVASSALHAARATQAREEPSKEREYRGQRKENPGKGVLIKPGDGVAI